MHEVAEVAEVILDTNSIEFNQKSGSILGKVYFCIGNEFFPDKDWSDFVVVVLGWWVEEISKIEVGKTKTFTLNFMDGPFFATGYLLGDNLVKIEFVKERLCGNDINHIAICDIKQLMMCILNAANDLVLELEKRALDNNDIARLKLLIKEAKVSNLIS